MKLRPGKIYDEGRFIFVALREYRRSTLCKVLVSRTDYRSMYRIGFTFKCSKESPRQFRSEILDRFTLRGISGHKLGRFYQ